MVGARLHPDGLLLEFRAIPRDRNDAADKLPPLDSRLETLFQRAGLKLSEYESTQDAPKADKRLGLPFSALGDARIYRPRTDASLPDVQVNIADDEIVWFHRPVAGDVIAQPDSAGRRFNDALYLTLMGTGIIGCYLAHRNSASQRADRRGAARSCVVVFVACLLSWTFTASHVKVFDGEVQLLQYGLANALFWSATQWLLFMSTEPFLRHSSPTGMTAWNRLIDGRWGDRLVARDILLGAMVGTTATPLLGGAHQVLRSFAGMTDRLELPPTDLAVLGNPSFMVAVFAGALVNAIYTGFVLLLLVAVLKSVVGNARVASIAAWGILALFLSFVYGTGIDTLTDRLCWFAYMGLWAAVFLTVVVRFGLLAAIVMVGVFQVIVFTPCTRDPDRWYGTTAVGTTAVMAAAIIGYSLWILLPRRSIYGAAA